MTDFQKILDAVLVDAKARKLTLDDIAKLILTRDHPALKGLDEKVDIKGTLGRSRETIIEQAAEKYRRESIETEQAFYADKLMSVPELAVLTDDQRKEIASKIVEVKKPEWIEKWNSTSPILIDGETEARL